MTDLVKGIVGKEDINFHDPSSGDSSVQTYNRTTSTGGTKVMTRPSTADVPILSPPFIVGRPRPFAQDLTNANHTAEKALEFLRGRHQEMINFEARGGTPGSGISAADAEGNVNVWNDIRDELVAGSRALGVFFPGLRYEFKDLAATTSIMSANLLDNIALMGTGFGTTLAAHSGATTSFDLFELTDCSAWSFQDMSLVWPGTVSGTCIKLISDTGDIEDTRILKCFIDGGGVTMDAAAATQNHVRFWMELCTFGTGFGFQCLGPDAGQVNRNLFLTSTAGQGIRFISGGGVQLMRDTMCVGNIFKGPFAEVRFNRTGVYTPANHRHCVAVDNFLLSGNIYLYGIDEGHVRGNTLKVGGIDILLTNMVEARDIHIVENYIENGLSGTGSGLKLDEDGNGLTGLFVMGNYIRNAGLNGMELSIDNAIGRMAQIQANTVEDASRWDGDATDYSAILLDAPSAAGGWQDCNVANNILRCRVATGTFGNIHKHGIEEVAGGLNDRNLFIGNNTKGYLTSDILISGGASVGDNNGTTLNLDGGAAL